MTQEHRQAAAILTSKFTEAVSYATAVHAGQLRKATSVPYIAHLLGVASLVLEAEGDEDMAIGGLLHDAAEDAGGQARLDDIRVRFGDRVAAYVEGCSDYLGSDPATKPDWHTRKRAYLSHLAQAPREMKIVSIADKVHNARAIHTDVLDSFDNVFGRFKVGPTDTIGYYRTCLAIAVAGELPHTLIEPLRTAVEGIEQTLELAEQPTWIL